MKRMQSPRIRGIKLCKYYRKQYGSNFISAMPTNLYGPEDNYYLESSRVLPALIRKMHEAKRANASSVDFWGSGEPRRELLHVDYCAYALVHVMTVYTGEGHVYVGCGEDLTILELTDQIRAVVGFCSEIKLDKSMPYSTQRKLLNVALLRELGWIPRIAHLEGLKSTYA